MIADDLVFDSVGIEEIEPAAGLIVAVEEWLEAGGDDPGRGGIEIVDFDADVVEGPPLGEVVRAVGDVASGVERDVVIVRSDMDRMTAVSRGAAPPDMPAEQCRHQLGGALGVSHGNVHVLNSWLGHGDRPPADGDVCFGDSFL